MHEDVIRGRARCDGLVEDDVLLSDEVLGLSPREAHVHP